MGRLCMDLYLKQLKKRYKKANKKNKSLILDEFCKTSGYHRKHAVRLLGKSPRKSKDNHADGRGRKRTYEPDSVLTPLKKIWLATDQMCGKRLKAAMSMWLPFYESYYGKISSHTKSQLLLMSGSTIDRLLKPTKVSFNKGRSGTKPGSLLRKHIPVKTNQCNEEQPGFAEADTVAHCGTSLIGDFVWSITLTDIYSGWTENRAIWNKGAQGVVEVINDIEENLPFQILGFDCDNGSEFLNYHLIRYFQKRSVPVQLKGRNVGI